MSVAGAVTVTEDGDGFMLFLSTEIVIFILLIGADKLSSFVRNYKVGEVSLDSAFY